MRRNEDKAKQKKLYFKINKFPMVFWRKSKQMWHKQYTYSMWKTWISYKRTEFKIILFFIGLDVWIRHCVRPSECSIIHYTTRILIRTRCYKSQRRHHHHIIFILFVEFQCFQAITCVPRSIHIQTHLKSNKQEEKNINECKLEMLKSSKRKNKKKNSLSWNSLTLHFSFLSSNLRHNNAKNRRKKIYDCFKQKSSINIRFSICMDMVKTVHALAKEKLRLFSKKTKWFFCSGLLA